MLHKFLLEATRITAEGEGHKLDRQRTKGEKPNRKRMAPVAAVYELALHADRCGGDGSGLRRRHGEPDRDLDPRRVQRWRRCRLSRQCAVGRGALRNSPRPTKYLLDERD
jgi:hypothetical protein